MGDFCPAVFESIQEDKITTWLSSFVGVERFTPGLDRIRDLFIPFNDIFKEKGISVVTIGGTNGKGETAYQLGHLLESSGVSVAIWSSPHILSIIERFSFKEPVTYDELEQSFFQTAQELTRKLSYYEFLFLNFLKLLECRKVDVVILEVGLGGRFDTVNLIEPSLTAITSISRDHEEILGRGYAKILYEKQGIARKGVKLIFALELSYCQGLLTKHLTALGAPYVDLFGAKICTTSMTYRERNRTLALKLFKTILKKRGLQEGPDRINRDIFLDSFKGRFEKMHLDGVEYHFVGGHNLDGIRKMVEEVVMNSIRYDSVLFSFSDRLELELVQFISLLKILKVRANILDMFITSFSHVRAASEELLKSISTEEIPFCEFKDVVSRTSKSKFVLVTGSYYFLGEVQKLLTQEKNV